VTVSYDAIKQELSCEDNRAVLKPADGKIRLRLVMDRTSIDIFGNDGRLYMPMGMIFSMDDLSLEIYAKGGGARISSLEVRELKSAWESWQNGRPARPWPQLIVGDDRLQRDKYRNLFRNLP
jgi:hypothetical protein